MSGPSLMWEQRYADAHYVFGTEPNDFLRAQLQVLPRGRVLCLAEGEGRNAVFLAEAGFEVHSIDLTEAGVAKTLQLAALAPDGVLLLEAYTPDQVGRGTDGPHDPALTMTLAGLRDELELLEFVHAVEMVRDVVEGVGHTGPGAVVQVLARKR